MRIQLGAIVTAMAGSIGGQTIRRSQFGQVMYNKSKAAPKNRLNFNSQVSRMQSIFKEFRNVDNDQRTTLQILAGKNLFKNKFGTPVQLPIYNYYVSCYSYIKLLPELLYENMFFDVSIPNNSIISFIPYYDNQEILLQLNDLDPTGQCIIRGNVSQSRNVYYNEKNCKIIYAGSVQTIQESVLFQNLIAAYPTANELSYVTLSFQNIANNGYAGGTVVLAPVQFVS